MSDVRSFAIVPAAGLSRRMGRDKLLLQVQGEPILQRVLQAWVESHVDEVVVVVRENHTRLIELCAPLEVHLVATPAAPAEMRDTLEIGLNHIARRLAPSNRDAWMAAPADMPGLTAETINHVLASYNAQAARPIVAHAHGRHGHPVLLPWTTVDAFFQLPRGVGLNSLVDQLQPEFVDVADQGAITDVDTQDDYQHFLRRRAD